MGGAAWGGPVEWDHHTGGSQSVESDGRSARSDMLGTFGQFDAVIAGRGITDRCTVTPGHGQWVVVEA